MTDKRLPDKPDQPRLHVALVERPCPDEAETECIARQLKTNGFAIFADEVRALWRARAEENAALSHELATWKAARPLLKAAPQPSTGQSSGGVSSSEAPEPMVAMSNEMEDFIRRWCYWRDAYGDEFRRATKALVANAVQAALSARVEGKP